MFKFIGQKSERKYKPSIISVDAIYYTLRPGESFRDVLTEMIACSTQKYCRYGLQMPDHIDISAAKSTKDVIDIVCREYDKA